MVDHISASNEWVVCVHDSCNHGAYAVVRVREEDLELGDFPATDDLKEIWKEIIAKPDRIWSSENEI